MEPMEMHVRVDDGYTPIPEYRTIVHAMLDQILDDLEAKDQDFRAGELITVPQVDPFFNRTDLHMRWNPIAP